MNIYATGQDLKNNNMTGRSFNMIQQMVQKTEMDLLQLTNKSSPFQGYYQQNTQKQQEIPILNNQLNQELDKRDRTLIQYLSKEMSNQIEKVYMKISSEILQNEEFKQIKAENMILSKKIEELLSKQYNSNSEFPKQNDELSQIFKESNKYMHQEMMKLSQTQEKQIQFIKEIKNQQDQQKSIYEFQDKRIKDLEKDIKTQNLLYHNLQVTFDQVSSSNYQTQIQSLEKIAELEELMTELNLKLEMKTQNIMQVLMDNKLQKSQNEPSKNEFRLQELKLNFDYVNGSPDHARFQKILENTRQTIEQAIKMSPLHPQKEGQQLRNDQYKLKEDDMIQMDSQNTMIYGEPQTQQIMNRIPLIISNSDFDQNLQELNQQSSLIQNSEEKQFTDNCLPQNREEQQFTVNSLKDSNVLEIDEENTSYIEQTQEKQNPLKYNIQSPTQIMQDLGSLLNENQIQLKKASSNEPIRDTEFRKFEEQSNQVFERITSITINENDLKQSNLSNESEKDMVYQLDEDGNLMDEDGNYILDENNNFVKLNEEQLQYLQQNEILDKSNDIGEFEVVDV